MSNLYYKVYRFNSISLVIIANEKQLVNISFGTKKTKEFETAIKKNTNLLETAILQLDEYFNKKRQKFDLPLKVQGTEFQIKVWKELCKIPYGKLISYQQLAKQIHHPKATRAAGSANGKNKFTIIIPCHRVIQKNGKLGGYSGPQGMKNRLVSFESI